MSNNREKSSCFGARACWQCTLCCCQPLAPAAPHSSSSRLFTWRWGQGQAQAFVWCKGPQVCSKSAGAELTTGSRAKIISVVWLRGISLLPSASPPPGAWPGSGRPAVVLPCCPRRKIIFRLSSQAFLKNMWQINVSRRCQMWEDVEEEGVCAPGRMYPGYPPRALWGCAGQDCGSAGHTVLRRCPRGYSALRCLNIALKWGKRRGFIFPGGAGDDLVMSPCPLVSPWWAWGCGSGGDELLKSIGAFGSSVSSEGPIIALTSAT